MERLTKRLSNGYITKTSDPHSFVDVHDRLAAYEDTGLEPEEVSALQTHPDHAYADYVRTLWHDIGGMERMEAVAKAEHEGRLLVLPCKVGDMVYYIRGQHTIGDTVQRIVLDGVDGQVIVDANHCYLFSDFGKTVFLTREDAEAALKECDGK